LDYVGVLACHHLEDLVGGVQITSAVLPRSGSAVGDVGRVLRDRVRAGLAVELDEELGVGRGFDVVLDAGHDHELSPATRRTSRGDGPSRSM
jgi:hypothetical protein